MILPDASVWIDLLRDQSTPQVDRLVGLLRSDRLAVGDLTLTEVLHGVRSERNFALAERMMRALPIIEIGGSTVAVQAARNYRLLRARGINVRKTIDTLLATRCIVDEHALLFSDRDFEPFVTHLGLRSAMD